MPSPEQTPTPPAAAPASRPDHFASIRSRPRHCLGCERELAEGEDLTAVLIEQAHVGKNAGIQFLRLNYCAACWRNSPWIDGGELLDEGQSASPADVFGAAPVAIWTAKVASPARRDKPRTFVDDAVLVNFFLRLADSEQEEHRRFRFVLMLILLRHKKLRLDGRRGPAAWQVRLTPAAAQSAGVDAAQVHPVTDPGLGEDQVQQVAEQLREILQQDIDQAEGDTT